LLGQTRAKYNLAIDRPVDRSMASFLAVRAAGRLGGRPTPTPKSSALWKSTQRSTEI